MDAESFIGRQEVQRDVADSRRMAGLAAVLDHQAPPWRPDVLPPLGHWLCFLPYVRQSLVGPDGHPLRTDDGLLPNVALPRRMWAGSRIRFLRPVPLGAAIVKTSTLTSAQLKSGRSGEMLFVTVRHQIALEDGHVAIEEEQDIVYREAAAPGAPSARASTPVEGIDPIQRVMVADPVLLFRYSALTFNSHRIHFDRDYCRQDEGYPGLVVHGPLIATLLMDHLLRSHPAAAVSSFSFRAASPLFDAEAITLGLTEENGAARLRAIGPAGVAMTATAEFTSGAS